MTIGLAAPSPRWGGRLLSVGFAYPPLAGRVSVLGGISETDAMVHLQHVLHTKKGSLSFNDDHCLVPRRPTKKPPHISVWGFGIKSLAVSYSHMIESHYHRR